MSRFGRLLVVLISAALAAGGLLAIPATAANADANGTTASGVSTPPDTPGPPGYTMAAPAARFQHDDAAPAADPGAVNGSYSHSPTAGSQPDLPAGGPTMHSLTVYNLFWNPNGTHFGSSASDDTLFMNLANQFVGDLNGTQYYNLVTQYYDTTNSNTHITNTASFGGSFNDTTTNFPHAGTTADPLLEGDITAEVASVVASQGWTEDLNHIVAVFTPKNIFECDASGKTDGHCNFPVAPASNGFFCAYHSHFSDSGTDTLFAYMGWDDMTHAAGFTCDAGDTSGDNDPNKNVYPSGNKGADVEISTLSHELIEAVTDPHPNAAWTASDGEIGDKCNYNYPPRADNGADVYLNGHPYIVQQEYSNAVHTCAIDLCGGGVCAPTVTATKTVDNATPPVTRTATYTVTLNNSNDTGAATNLAFTDTVPSGYTVSTFSAPNSTTSSSTSNSVTVNYDTLAVHTTRTISITVNVPKQAGVKSTNCGGLAFDDLLSSPQTSITTNPCADTTPALIPSSLTYNGPTTQDYNDPVAVSARLADDLNNPITGATVNFSLNATDNCSGVTDGSGEAGCNLTPSEPAGTYPLVTSFSGSDTYGPVTTTVNFVVTKEETTTDYTGPTIVANGMPATLSGVLKEDGTTPIAGRTLTLSLGAGVTQQSCTGVTDGTGTASCTIASVNQPLGAGTATASFAGDAFYLPSSGSKTTILFQYTAGGSFVVGDASVGPIGSSIGKTVTFWGSQWAKTNVVSGGAAPSAFKGFANSPMLPSAGTPWKSDPGNSANPPNTVPLYTAMIVSSAIAKSGSTINGSDVHVVIVKVSPGYGPDPGKTSTATIVAVLA